MWSLREKIFLIVTIFALLASGYLFVKNRQLADAAVVGRHAAEIKKRIKFAKERIRAAEDIAVVFQFSLQPDVGEETMNLVRKRLGKLGDDRMLKEWEELQKVDSRKGPIYSLRVRNLFLAILEDANRILEK